MARSTASKKPDSPEDSEQFVSVFSTEMGWMGIVGHVNVVRSVVVGHSSAESVRKANQKRGGKLEEADWNPQLRKCLQDYALGREVSFDEFQLELPDRTPFRDKVLAATRRLKYGETTTYGDLARRVGHPGAARAVGTVMSSNRFPIIIPCHRVLASGNKIGGYTCPAGLDMKVKLLEMECPGSFSN